MGDSVGPAGADLLDRVPAQGVRERERAVVEVLADQPLADVMMWVPAGVGCGVDDAWPHRDGHLRLWHLPHAARFRVRTGKRPVAGGLPRRGLRRRTAHNTPVHLIRSLQHPRSVDPHTATPDTGVTVEAARDIATYLCAIG